MTHETAPTPDVDLPDPKASLEVLVENHRAFLRFLERRVGSKETAEDLLQDAFGRAVTHLNTLRDGESAVAWFYRLLRNAVIDHYRRRAAQAGALERFAAELDDTVPPPEVSAEISCLRDTPRQHAQARVRGGPGADRRAGSRGQGLRGAAWPDREQRRRAGIPRATGAPLTGRGLLRHLRRSRLPRLLLRPPRA